MSQILEEFAALGRPEMNQRSPRALALRHPGFLADHDCFSTEELERDPVYTDFLRPRGFGWCAGTPMFVPGGDTLFVTIERHFAKGPVTPAEVERLNRLRPHIARAAALSARLALDRVRAAAQALGLIGLPAAVLGSSHRLLAANVLLDALMPSVFRDMRERVSLTDAAADTLLADTLARGTAHVEGAVQSIPLPAGDGHGPMVLHVLPIRGAAHDIFTSASAILLVTPVGPGAGPSQQLLEGLFDLTPAEARIAQALSWGETLETVAASFGLSRETIRTQLRGVFHKAGTRRQPDLVRLLAGSWSQPR